MVVIFKNSQFHIDRPRSLIGVLNNRAHDSRTELELERSRRTDVLRQVFTIWHIMHSNMPICLFELAFWGQGCVLSIELGEFPHASFSLNRLDLTLNFCNLKLRTYRLTFISTFQFLFALAFIPNSGHIFTTASTTIEAQFFAVNNHIFLLLSQFSKPLVTFLRHCSSRINHANITQ